MDWARPLAGPQEGSDCIDFREDISPLRIGLGHWQGRKQEAIVSISERMEVLCTSG